MLFQNRQNEGSRQCSAPVCRVSALREATGKDPAAVQKMGVARRGGLFYPKCAERPIIAVELTANIMEKEYI